MKNKISLPLVIFFASFVFLICISTNIFAQKEIDSISISGGIFSNSTFTFPNTKDHEFSVKGEGNQRSITMHNNIKSGKYVEDITVSMTIPNKALGEYKFSKDLNTDQLQLMVTIVRNLNDEPVNNHNIGAVNGVFKITSTGGNLISGTYEANGEEIDMNTMATIKYILKGNFNAVQIN